MKPEGPVTFHLRLTKPLIAGRFVGEVGVRSGVVGHIGWFFPTECRFDIKQSTISAGAVALRIPDSSEGIIARLRALLSW